VVQGASEIDGSVVGEDVECSFALEEVDAGENGSLQQSNIIIKIIMMPYIVDWLINVMIVEKEEWYKTL